MRRCASLYLAARLPDSTWASVAALIEAPAPAGMAEVFSDTDEAGEMRARRHAHDERRTLIATELANRKIVASMASRPGMAERIAALLPGKVAKK